jgi:hypothetical protein
VACLFVRDREHDRALVEVRDVVGVDEAVALGGIEDQPVEDVVVVVREHALDDADSQAAAGHDRGALREWRVRDALPIIHACDLLCDAAVS